LASLKISRIGKATALSASKLMMIPRPPAKINARRRHLRRGNLQARAATRIDKDVGHR
jgi:hypothetical protein